jgi:hypothetical protein
MNPSDYIKQRQILWALRQGKRLGGQYRNHCDPETDQADSTSSDSWCEAIGAGYDQGRRSA